MKTFAKALVVGGVVGACALGCAAVETEAPGAVMLVVTTDAPATGPRMAFDRVRVVVNDERLGARHVRWYDLNPAKLKVPATLTIAARQGQRGSVTRVQVSAFDGESELHIDRFARVVLPPSGIERLQMPLKTACVGVFPPRPCSPDENCRWTTRKPCGEAETCVDGWCQTMEVVGKLPPYSVGPEPACTPEDAAARCAAAGRTCGALTAADHCGEVKTIDCGHCADAGPPDAAAPDAAPAVDSGPVCAAGTYVTGPSCTACPGGTFSAGTNAPQCAPWNSCSAGQYVSTAPSATANRGCTACGTGTYTAATNAGSCNPWTGCSAGQYVSTAGSASNDRACTTCGAGTYSNTSNAAGCTACAAGTGSGPGATSCSAGALEVYATTARMTGDGLDNCGTSAADVCARSLLVTGGTFYRGTTASYPATISDFRLDKYEVTVGRFRKFVDAWVAGWRPSAGMGKHAHLNSGRGLASTAGGYEPGWDGTWTAYVGAPDTAAVIPSGAGAANRNEWDSRLDCWNGYASWTGGAATNERKPMNCMTWYELHAFCVWDGGFLPAEAEWEYAAAGGSEERPYPWGGSVPDPNVAMAIYGCYLNGTGQCTGATNIAAVGTVVAGASKVGHLDLGGNVSEWNLDWDQSPYVAPCSNCTNLSAGLYRALRGGSFNVNATHLASADRGSDSPSSRNIAFGGRCARVP